MKQRIISTVILWGTLLVLLASFGVHAGAWLIAIMASLTQWELYQLLEKNGLKPHKRSGSIAGGLVLLAIFYAPQSPVYDIGTALFALLIIGFAVLALQELRQDYLSSTLFPTLGGLLLVPFMLQFFVRLLQQYDNIGLGSEGLCLGLWIIAVTKFTDVGGLLVGRKIGQHKLAPRISPGKTWEGVAGGILCSALISFLLLLFFGDYFPPHLGLIEATLIAIPIGAIGILSDLMESILKRYASVKDSGNSIPGIGGVFDLTDSLLFSTPLAYFLLQLSW